MLINADFICKFVTLLICVCSMCIMVAYIRSDKLLLRINYTASVHVKHCTIILRIPSGRLGNNLFQFATAYGLSLDHSCYLYIAPNIIKQLRLYFEISLPNLLTDSELNHTLPVKRIHNHCTYFSDLFHQNTSQNIELVGFWQVHKYFVNHIDQIRYQLRFQKTVLDQAKRFIKTNITRTNLNLVGIHIRRGDFVGNRNISSDKFIFDAMNYFTRKYVSVIFIFVSDDKVYCRRVFGRRNDTFFTPHSFTPIEDMAVITLCDHAIITVGTYGWWAAFLLHNKIGEVLTDAKPNHSPIDVNCERSVFFPSWFSFLNKTK